MKIVSTKEYLQIRKELNEISNQYEWVNKNNQIIPCTVTKYKGQKLMIDIGSKIITPLEYYLK